jgi:hypothetical protein
MALGQRLAGSIEEPEVFLAALADGLRGLVDPAYARMMRTICPGVTTEYAVRGPLLALIHQPLRLALREASSATALWLAGRLVGAGHRDLRLFALLALERSLADDPEQSWQLMRRLAGRAEDWVDTDSLAGLWARGVLAEPFRWAELEQLVYSAHQYERRLVGATLASLPHRLPRARRDELCGLASRRAFALLGQLMGDAAEVVQKALSWAIRSWAPIDPEAASALLERETALAVAGDDGARAWVIRDSLTCLPHDEAAAIRLRLAGIRRRRDTLSTSPASVASARFALPTGGVPDLVARQGLRASGSHA